MPVKVGIRQLESKRDQKIGILHVGKSQFERNIEEKRRARLEEATRKAELKEQREKEMEAQLATGEWVKTPSGKQLMKPHQTTYVDVFGNEQISRRARLQGLDGQQWSATEIQSEAVAACSEQRSSWGRSDLMLEIARDLPQLAASRT